MTYLGRTRGKEKMAEETRGEEVEGAEGAKTVEENERARLEVKEEARA